MRDSFSRRVVAVRLPALAVIVTSPEQPCDGATVLGRSSRPVARNAVGRPAVAARAAATGRGPGEREAPHGDRAHERRRLVRAVDRRPPAACCGRRRRRAAGTRTRTAPTCPRTAAGRRRRTGPSRAPRSSVAFTVSVVGAFAGSVASAAGAVHAISGGWSSNGPPGVAWVETFSHVVETMSSVSASTVSVPAPHRIVSGEPSRARRMSSSAPPSSTSLPSPPVRSPRPPVTVSRLTRPSPTIVTVPLADARRLDVLDVGADQVVLAGLAVVRQAVERERGAFFYAVARPVDPVAAGERVGAGVRPQDVVAVAAAERVVAE